MALIVTAGSSSADSYATVAACDSYHSARGNATWTGTDTLKEQALRRATQWLDGRYGSRWPGTTTYGRDQALDWPRAWVEDASGYAVATETIPQEVVNATCEAALRELVSPGSLSPDVTPGTVKVLTEVKGIRWTPLRSSAGASDMAPVIAAVDGALSGLMIAGRGLVPVARG